MAKVLFGGRARLSSRPDPRGRSRSRNRGRPGEVTPPRMEVDSVKTPPQKPQKRVRSFSFSGMTSSSDEVKEKREKRRPILPLSPGLTPPPQDQDTPPAGGSRAEERMGYMGGGRSDEEVDLGGSSPTFGSQMRSRLEIAALKSPLRLRSAVERSNTRGGGAGHDDLSWSQDSESMLDAVSTAAKPQPEPKVAVASPAGSEEMGFVLEATMQELDQEIGKMAVEGKQGGTHLSVDVSEAVEKVKAMSSLNLRPQWKSTERPLPAPVQIAPRSKEPASGFVQLGRRRARESPSSGSDGSDFCRGPYPKIRGESRVENNQQKDVSPNEPSLFQMASKPNAPPNIDPDLLKESGPASTDAFGKALESMDSVSGGPPKAKPKKVDFNERQKLLMASGRKEEILKKREEDRSRSRSLSSTRRERDAVTAAKADRHRRHREEVAEKETKANLERLREKREAEKQAREKLERKKKAEQDQLDKEMEAVKKASAERKRIENEERFARFAEIEKRRAAAKARSEEEAERAKQMMHA